MAYFMKFKKKTGSIVGDERDEEDPTNDSKRYFASGRVYEIQANDAVSFHQSKLANFVRNPNK